MMYTTCFVSNQHHDFVYKYCPVLRSNSSEKGSLILVKVVDISIQLTELCYMICDRLHNNVLVYFPGNDAQEFTNLTARNNSLGAIANCDNQVLTDGKFKFLNLLYKFKIQYT